MLHLSRFVPDPTRTGEFLACLWQGAVPDDLILHRWLYTTSSTPSMVLVWEGGHAAREYVRRAFGGFGDLTTEVMTDATPGLAACFDRDLSGFGTWLASRGMPDDEVTHQLDVRRSGLDAPSPDAAAAAGRAWSGARRV